MAKGSGFVAFYEEVSGPGKTVSDNGPGQRIQRVPNAEWDHDGQQSKTSANGVQPAVHRFTVFLKVEGKELFVVGKVRGWQKGVSPALLSVSYEELYAESLGTATPVP